MIHGGDIYHGTIAYDFSVNTNPYPCPETIMDAAREAILRLNTYPEYQSEGLRKAIARAEGYVPQGIVCGNGASELFVALARAIGGKRALVLGPGFYGYEHALKSCHYEIDRYLLQEENDFLLQEDYLKLLTKDIDLIFLANPNNPTGRRIDPVLLKEILQICRRNEIAVVLDECFLPLSQPFGNEEHCSWDRLFDENPNLYVVRAFTKLFSVPGARIGYLLCLPSKQQSIYEQIPEWNISVLADTVGQECARILEDTDYAGKSVEYIENQKKVLSEAFTRAGIRVYPSDTNYLLIYTKTELKTELLKQSILIRDCSNFEGLGKGYYRIAVKDEASNERLIDAIFSICTKMK